MSVALCRECGAEIEYEPSVSPLLAGLRPSLCGPCSASIEAEHGEEAALAERELRNVPQRYAQSSFANFAATTPSQAAALEAVRDHAPEGVMLLGKAGCGKTHLACAAISAGPAGSLFANTAAMLDDIRRSYSGEGRASQGLFGRALNAPLLALDDLGSESATDWVRDRLYTLINHRWDNCLPLLVTSNVPAADLAGRIGQGVASRIAGCCARRIRIQGPDGRQAEVKH